MKTSAAPAVPPVESQAEDLKLETGEALRGQKYWARFYFPAATGDTALDSALKQIKRWVKTGKDQGQPAPIHDPAAMERWYDELKALGVYKHRCPQAITDAAHRPKTVATPPAADEPASLPASSDRVAPIDLSQFRPEDFGYDSMLNASKLILQVAESQLAAAYRSDDESRRRKALADYEKAHASYLNAAKSRAKIEQATGNMLPKEEVRAHLIDIHAHIPRTTKRRFTDAFPQLLDLAQDFEAWKEFVEQTVHSICAQLRKDKFANAA